MSKSIKTNWFYGNEVSDYGKECHRVDYRTLAKAFESVLNNQIMSATQDIGYWEPITTDEYREDEDGTRYTPNEAEELIEELKAEQDEIDVDEDAEAYDALSERIDALEEPHYYEVFQWYIVDDNGFRILQEWTNEILYYNEELDIALWGVTHWGTSWDYVLTDIEIESDES